MSAFDLYAKGLSKAGKPKSLPEEFTSLDDFFFSDCLAAGSPLVKQFPDPKHCLKGPINPSKPIFYSPDTGNGLSRETLRHSSLKVANALKKLRLPPPPKHVPGLAGDIGSNQHTILLHMPNSLAFPILVFAGLAGKFILTMANPALTTTELAHIIRESKPHIAFTYDGEGIKKVQAAYKEAGANAPAALFAVRGIDGMATAGGNDGVPTWTDLLKEPQPLQVEPMSKAQMMKTVSFILWSSGTTGKSKGVVLPHYALIAQAISLWIGNPIFSSDERFIAMAPFYHTYGLSNVLLLAPLIGATAFLLPKFSLETYLRMATRYRITHYHIVPPVAVQLHKSPLLDDPSIDISAVTGFTSGGAPLGPPVIRELARRTGIGLRMGYGTSEAGSITTMRGTTWKELEPQLGSTGRPMWGGEIRIIGGDGKVAAQGESGEILTRSPNQMLGYINNPTATAETLDEEGWVHSGDVGLFDKDGNLFIVDRIKEVIKYKGFQVSPSELDGVINGLPTVADVGVTAVYSDEEGSELPIAYVVPRTPLKDPTAIRKFAFDVRNEVERKCAKYKWLRGGVVVTDAIPKNPSGKILRRMLKEVKGTHVPVYSRESKL